MRNKKILLSIALAAILLQSPVYAQSDRKTTNINRGWLFLQGEASSSITSEKAKADGWKEVNLPHDFQIEQPWVAPAADEKANTSDAGANIKSRLSARGFKEMGSGWYVRSFTPSKDDKGKRISIDFQGIMYLGDVYLNGEKIGGTDYGYVGFEIDITDKLRYGEENTIAVYSNTAQPRDSRWYTGGGLFRDVNILYTDPLLYFNRHPLNISTRENKYVDMTVDVQCKTKQNTIAMQVIITSPDGTVVSDRKHELKRVRNYKYGQEFALPAVEIANPQLWNCENPNLYTAIVRLIREDGTVSDEVTKRFGIRDVALVAGKGLLLNGKKVLLKGYANHHTLGALGAAAYPRAMEKRIKLMKESKKLLKHFRISERLKPG